MYQYFKTNEAAANHSGAMEAETISKNGAKPKSHTSRRNFKILALVVLVAAGIMAIKSCKKDDEKNVSQSVIDLVAEGGVLPGTEGEVQPDKEEIVSSAYKREENQEPPPGWITRQSESNLDCHVFNPL